MCACVAVNSNDVNSVNNAPCLQSSDAAVTAMDCTDTMVMLTDVVDIISTDLANEQVTVSTKLKCCLQLFMVR